MKDDELTKADSKLVKEKISDIGEYRKLPLDSIKTIIESDIVKCILFYLKYYYTKDEMALKQYYKIFTKLDIYSQARVSASVLAHLDNKNEYGKKIIKMKGNDKYE